MLRPGTAPSFTSLSTRLGSGRQEILTRLGLEETVKALGGASPTLSKLALITTMKDGVLKHRLILDCRVSGVNDHSHKIERVLLPSAWDIIHDTLADLCYMVLVFRYVFFHDVTFS